MTAKLIKTLSFILFLNVIHAYSMEDGIPNQKRLRDSEEEIILYTKKDPRLLLGLPNEVLKVIINYAYNDSVFHSAKLLIRLSLVCKEFECLSKPDMIKTTLNLTQKVIDSTFDSYAFFKKYNCAACEEDTPFLKLLVAMNAQTNSLCKDLISCVALTTNSYVVEHFIMHHHANVDQQDERGFTPLRIVISVHKPNNVRVLLKHNANMYLADNTGLTPMEMALLMDDFECIKAFIEYGIDTTINYSRNEKYTLTIADWAQRGAWSDKKNAAIYDEIYKSVTGEEIPKSWNEKSVSELLGDTCVIS